MADEIQELKSALEIAVRKAAEAEVRFEEAVRLAMSRMSEETYLRLSADCNYWKDRAVKAEKVAKAACDWFDSTETDNNTVSTELDLCYAISAYRFKESAAQLRKRLGWNDLTDEEKKENLDDNLEGY